MKQEKKRLDPDTIKRPPKWKFESFFSVDLKVLDRQPLLGRGPLSTWLRNLAHSRAMVALDTYRDNVCLWRCISVNKGALRHRSTESARKLAKSFFKLDLAPNNVPKTSLDELEKVEKHLNQGAPFSDWLGIRVYEPEYLKEGKTVWHLRRNSPAKLTNVMTIGVNGGSRVLIKNIAIYSNI